MCSSHKAYRAGAFDFLAAYVVLEDVWYIIPARLIYGLKSISLCTEGGEAKYEEYREAWHLLREASGIGAATSIDSTQDKGGAPDDEAERDQTPMGPAYVRMQNAFNFFRRQLEKGGRMPQE